jgi:protein ImuA
MSREVLTALRERVRRIERPTAAAHGVAPFGVAAIDRALPGGGLARGALHEILGMGGDEEDGALAAAFAAGILARLGKDGIVLWCLPRPDIYGPGLAGCGLDPGRLVLVRVRRDAEILWAMEEGLRAPGVAAVVGEVGVLAAVASRRLQLTAEHSGVTALVLRRWRDGDEAARERNRPNVAATRWRIAALPSQPVPIPAPAHRIRNSPLPIVRHPRESGDPEPAPDLNRGASGTSLATLGPRFRGGDGHFREGDGQQTGSGRGTGPGIGHARWRVELLRCRGGEPASWEMEVTDATGSLCLADALADRPDAPRRAGPSEQFQDEQFQDEQFQDEQFRRTG